MTYLFFLYAFMIPFEYLQEKIPKGPTGINYVNLSMLLMLGFWIIRRTSRGRSLAVRSPLNMMLILFLAYNYFGLVLGAMQHGELSMPFDPGSGTFKWFRQLANAILIFWFAGALLESRKDLHRGMVVLALASPWVFRVFYNQLHSMSGWHYSDELRIKGPFVYIGSNELAAFFLFSALFFLVMALCRGGRWRDRLLFGMATGLYGYGILYSYSRGTQLAAIVAIGVMGLLRYRRLLLVMVVAWVTLPMWLPRTVQERWDMTYNEQGELDESAQRRKEYWALARRMFMERPIFGHGLKTFALRNPTGQIPHNMYYRTLAEQGLVGFMIFMSIWGVILHMGVRLYLRGPESFDRVYGLALVVATCGLMVANYFGDRFTYLAMIGHYWILVGMGARLYAHMQGWEPLTDAEPETPTTESEPAETRSGSPGASGSLAPALTGPGINRSRGMPQVGAWVARKLRGPRPGRLEVVRPSPPIPEADADGRSKSRRLNIVGRRPEGGRECPERLPKREDA